MTAAATPPADDAVPLGWRVGVAVIFALLHGWFLFTAASNLIALPALYAAQGYDELIPWTTLILGVALPPVFYVVALLLGRRRMLSARVVVLAASLAATAASALTLYVLA